MKHQETQTPKLPISGRVLLLLNAILIVGVLLLLFPLIRMAMTVSVLQQSGLSDPRSVWALSLLGLSLLGLFGLWRCRRPTEGWVIVTCLCLIGLGIHGFAGVDFQTVIEGVPSGIIVLAVVRLILGVLLGLDLWKCLKTSGESC